MGWDVVSIIRHWQVPVCKMRGLLERIISCKVTHFLFFRSWDTMWRNIQSHLQSVHQEMRNDETQATWWEIYSVTHKLVIGCETTPRSAISLTNYSSMDKRQHENKVVQLTRWRSGVMKLSCRRKSQFNSLPVIVWGCMADRSVMSLTNCCMRVEGKW